MSEAKELIGKVVVLTVSDPWEFQDENGGATFEAAVEQISDSAILLHFADPLRFGVNSYAYMVSSSRHGIPFGRLSQRTRVACNGIAIPEQRLREARKLDVSWWRAGAAVIGTLSLKQGRIKDSI